MNPIVTLVTFGWIPVVYYLFIRFPAERAIVIGTVTAELFLPVVRPGMVPAIPVIPIDKFTVTSYGIVIAIMIFDPKRLNNFQPKALDTPMIMWLLSVLFSQVTMGISPISPLIGHIIGSGIPYLIGRIYFDNLAALRQLAVGIFAGGVAYMPFTLLEMKIAPVLHQRLYGYHARDDFAQNIRYGGYRPTVFMVHGLWVGMWMMGATLIGIWLWRSGAIKKLGPLPMMLIVPALFVVFVLCKSTAVYGYLLFGVVILLVCNFLNLNLPLLLFSAMLSTYLMLCMSGNFYTIPAVRAWLSKATDERSGSVAFRIKNEEPLSAKAREKLIFGWANSGGGRIYDAYGRDISVTDSLWIITFGSVGLFGTLSMMTTLLLPCILFALRYPPKSWSKPEVGGAAALSMLLVLYFLDILLNAMSSMSYIVVCGGLTGLALRAPEINKKKVKVLKPVAKKKTLAQRRS